MKNDQMSFGEKLPQLLAARGVEVVFGIPGVHTVELYRGLDASGLRHVTPRHEQGAGFMADGYARVSGKPGVCFIISGPGMTNILTAMGQAYGDSIPMLVISTVNAHGRMGSGEGWLHEMPDQSGMIGGVSAFSRTVHHPDELDKALNDAFAIFSSARPRPVHIEIPINILMQPVSKATSGKIPKFAPPSIGHQPAHDVVSMLNEANSPVILVGGGARGADIQSLSERIDAPVVMTTNARGLLPVGHKLAVPVTATLPKTRALIANADVVLAIGTELGPTDYDMFEDGGFSIPGQFIRIDIDPCQTTRPFPPDLSVTADAAHAVKEILRQLEGASPTQMTGAQRAATACEDVDSLSDQMLVDLGVLNALRDHFPNSHIVGDSTQYVYAGNMAFEMTSGARYFNSACGFGTLGYGLPAAIGASIASDQRAICLSGDGGLQFCLGELATAREIDANVLLLLHDNQGYGEIKSYMVDKGIPEIGVDIYTPDLVQIAKAAGWAVLCSGVEALDIALIKAGEINGPIMVYITEDARRIPFPSKLPVNGK
jgi:acetolactate synthase-1/2/3 large subunit